MRTLDKALVPLLYAALDSPLGVVVETPRPEDLRNRLYKARREAKAHDERVTGVAFVVSPANPDTHLWIVKKPSKGGVNGAQGRDPAAKSDAVPLRRRLRSPARAGTRVERK